MKTYIKPESKAFDLDTESVIAMSFEVNYNTTVTNENEVLKSGRRSSDWDDYEGSW